MQNIKKKKKHLQVIQDSIEHFVINFNDFLFVFTNAQIIGLNLVF